MTSPDTVVPLRSAGRPVGQKKTGGRKLGSKNRRTLEVEQFLRPALPAAKKRLKALLDSDNEDVAMRALIMVFGYIYGKPTEKRLIGGTGDPIQTEAVPSFLDSHDAARRVAAMLTSARDAVPEVAEFVESVKPNGAETTSHDVGRGNGSDAGPNSCETAPENPIPADLGELPPAMGNSFLFGAVELRNNGPQRAGLPDSFSVFQDGQFHRTGSFAVCIAEAKKVLGEPLPPARPKRR